MQTGPKKKKKKKRDRRKLGSITSVNCHVLRFVELCAGVMNKFLL
jgi:hypothetical protein